MSSNERKNTDTNFTNVVYEDIKQKLVRKMKSHYPNTYSDFNKSSFGSLMVDLVSMMSEQLNFYTQFVANENYPQTSRSAYSLNYHAQTSGKPVFNSYSSTGIIKVVTHLPAAANTGPDTSFRHAILKGTKFRSQTGGVFTSLHDVAIDFSTGKSIGTIFTEDGSSITYYAYEVDVPVISGEDRTFSVTVPEYQKFLKIEVKDVNVTDVLKVVDSTGNEYYRVENLSQNVIYRALPDTDFDNSQLSSKLVPFPVPRRFMIDYEGDKMFLVFGYGSQESLKVKPVADPSQIALLKPGQGDYIYDTDFDPAKLLSTDKFGVAPQNTTLNITYRANTVENSNAAAGSVTSLSNLKMSFNDATVLQPANRKKIDFIKTNISCENMDPINGVVQFESTQALAQSIHAARKAQSRAVTAHDYETVAYLMPSSFGSIKRVSVTKDRNELTRNLNMYVIAENSSGNLEKCSAALKDNLKSWINEYRMVSDSIDIFDASILNLGLEIDVSLKRSANPQTSLSAIRSELFREMNLITPTIGQHFSIGFVEEILNSISTISRVNKIKTVVKNTSGYSDTRIDIKSSTSLDGGMIIIPDNTIWEIKNKADIIGRIN